MNTQHPCKRSAPFLLPLVLLLAACSQDAPDAAAVAEPEAKLFKPVQMEQPAGDVIARVEDQQIRFSEVNTMLNSSAVVGLSLPALGTPERDTVRITLLDKMISANLLYLDALRKGVDKDPGYQAALRRFSNAMLADLYFRQNMAGNIPVSEAEIQALYAESVTPDEAMNEELRAVLEATVRKRKLGERQLELRDTLREGTDVTIYQANFNPDGDAGRPDSTVVAEFAGQTITWGEVRDRLMASGRGAVARDALAMESEARLNALQSEIDTRLLAQKARAAGLDQDSRFSARYSEYRKTRLINLHRANLARDMAPTDAELESYFEANRTRIVMPEFRKVQMVMLDSEAEARSVKQRIEAGEITLYQAAAEHSVAPDAKQNLGELGWIARDKLKPELNTLVFQLGPGEIGGPVQAGGLWHLATVQDVREAQHADLADEATRKHTRRMYIHEKLDAYVVDLRRNTFKVEVYEDELVRLAQQEADMVKQLTEQAGDPASVTRQRIEEMQKLITP